MLNMDAKTKNSIAAMLKEFGVLSAYLFGSYVQGTQRADSDLDIMVKLQPSYSLFDILDIRLGLEDRLGVKVDLVPEDSVVPELEESIAMKAMNEEKLPMTLKHYILLKYVA